MTKQRRSFFVDDILHMVMPKKENRQSDGKRKRSISSEDVHPAEEEITTKKAWIQDLPHDDRNEESDYSRVVDVLREDEDDDDDDVSVDEEENDEQESEEDDDDDDESLDNVEVNEDLRKAVEKALGDAVAKDDDEV